MCHVKRIVLYLASVECPTCGREFVAFGDVASEVGGDVFSGFEFKYFHRSSP